MANKIAFYWELPPPGWIKFNVAVISTAALPSWIDFNSQLFTGRVKHWKPVGTFLEQTLRSKLREIGMLRLMPKMLALIAVQRQAAASRSTRPLRREQHGITGGEPTVTLTKLSTLAHTPNLRASLGHLPRADGVGVGVGLGLEP
ncbi:hypothetical protein Goarm_015666 [Gossypium armourianum]|uniref:Uncharacterized protein n=1 Tax=Gossypium armourianum TaxID=34283 RepID=A0A7J9JBE0_9ROSI|nr:hypothetical protein [Gossypium armourianum]